MGGRRNDQKVAHFNTGQREVNEAHPSNPLFFHLFTGFY